MNKELMVLIGAGASYGQHDKVAPPLGCFLADTLREIDCRFGDIEKKSGVRCGGDFERWLKEVGEDPVLFTSSLAVLSNFFRKFDRVQNDSRYYDLIDAISPGLIDLTVFVSLNYETLMEQSLRRRGYSLNWGSGSFITDAFNFNVDASANEVMFLKPHGSSHFIAHMSKEPVTNKMCCTDITSQISCETLISEAGSALYDNNVLSVMSAYEPEKRNAYNDNFILEVRESSLKAAASVRVLLVIGMRYLPEDKFVPKIFDAALKEGLKIAYIGSSSDFSVIFDSFSNKNIDVIHLSEKFDSAGLLSIKNFLLSEQ